MIWHAMPNAIVHYDIPHRLVFGASPDARTVFISFVGMRPEDFFHENDAVREISRDDFVRIAMAAAD